MPNGKKAEWTFLNSLKLNYRTVQPFCLVQSKNNGREVRPPRLSAERGESSFAGWRSARDGQHDRVRTLNTIGLDT